MKLFLIMAASSSLIIMPLASGSVMMLGALLTFSVSMIFFTGSFVNMWFSYILFLIYIGGLLVLFMYIVLVSSQNPILVELTLYVPAFSLGCLSSWAFFGPMETSVMSKQGASFPFMLLVPLGAFLLLVFLAASSMAISKKQNLVITPDY
uniref:NADH dehydrogenase subunit 6 n=1 Tax=Imerinia grandidieri TaxID=3244470 RepID=G8HQX2_9EUPU|nr:NADH dehydrogenase subunit 6 [Rhopalocaulis grandidieri]